MSINTQTTELINKLQKSLKRNYLLKDFSEFRNDLLNYANAVFPDKIQDFSEASVGGMLLDFAAIVGDSLSFYMDHQFNELNPNTAVERRNIENHMKRAGIKMLPASPSVVEITFSITVSNDLIENNTLPKILKGLRMRSIGIEPINFYLLEDINFNESDKRVLIPQENNTTIITKKGIAISGERKKVNFIVPNGSFPSITLPDLNITMIEKVYDITNYNEYYEVEFLTQDTVYKSNTINNNGDKYYEVIPAPYRFVKESDLQSGRTIIRFGAGNVNTSTTSLIQDPTKSVLSLYGRDYFPKFSFDPGSLLKTNSLGIAPNGSNIEITYSFGGGARHNVNSRTINEILNLNDNIIFHSSTNLAIQNVIKNSISITNEFASVGGANGLTFNELKSQLNNIIKMQNRIVNYQDLLAKIYSMPAPFGKVSKIALEDDPNNIYAKNMYILCTDADSKFVIATDVLKTNLSNYLNEFRLIGDQFNILDAKILNLKIDIKLKVSADSDAQKVCEMIKTNIQKYFRDNQFEINQPIVLLDLYRIVSSTNGVLSIVTKLEDFITQRKGVIERNNQTFFYSNDNITIKDQIINDILYPVKGSIFELKYPSNDIVISNVTQ